MSPRINVAACAAVHGTIPGQIGTDLADRLVLTGSQDVREAGPDALVERVVDHHGAALPLAPQTARTDLAQREQA